MKPILSAAVLLLCSALAHAEPTQWTFTYTGFYDGEASAFLPDAVLSGSFTGEDTNADGVLDRVELTSLVLAGRDYVACAAYSSALAFCGADRFSFSPQAGLAFSAGEYGGDAEGYVGGGHLYTSGEMDYSYRYDPYASSEHHLYWTADTRLSLSTTVAAASVVSAVPEAPAWAMLLVGLGALGGGRAWRRRRFD